MATAVMTSKGQVTIPADVRRRMGLDSGDRVEFVELEGGGFAIKPAVDDVRSLKGLLRKPGSPVAIADMDKAIREGAVRGRERER
ncbi:MAG: AbrB/MazE/SpoVT family DNA-binding domain-containing protein [Candidatus Accumulibacter sp.]|nr:AbrB/MazE/SpoVT family DNA-binding domain-containing protein [Accumulibacter sp.]MCP5229074.1 AbrB/MazE/SpoVT family DNA-binding domain-containing protein [Accumulibacter sp.]